MSELVIDLETDGLLDTLTKVWCLGVGDPMRDEITIYADQPGYPSLQEGIARISKADRLIGHNLLGFDFHVLHRFWPGKIKFEQLYDTLILSRMIDPERREHSLASLGTELGEPKGEFNEFSRFSEEMVRYLEQDIRVSTKVYYHLSGLSKHSDLSVEVEHKTALAISLQEQHGFPFDLPAAIKLEEELRSEKDAIEEDLHRHFPPRWVALCGSGKSVRFPWASKPSELARCVKTPKVNRAPYTKDAPFTPVDLRKFNLSSNQHVEARLRGMGWKPTKFTASGAAQLDAEVLRDIAVLYPAAAPLVRYARVEKVLGQLVDGTKGWLKIYREHPDGSVRVHGRVNTIGAGTHRMSHHSPNLAQVDKKEERMREVWVPTKGRVMSGTDADAIEARGLGNYLAPLDGGEFAIAVDQGTKAEGTDIHTRNLKATGMWKRDKGMSVKNLFYAYLLF